MKSVSTCYKLSQLSDGATHLLNLSTAEEISGIFIKCIAPSSVAARCGKIQENDQIIEVDGRSLHGYTNSEAVDLLRKTQKVVKLKLARLKGGQSLVDDAGESTSVVTTPVSAPSHSHSAFSHSTSRYMNGSTVIEVNNGNIYESVNPIGGISTPAEAVAKWEPIIGPQHDIIVCVFDQPPKVICFNNALFFH